MLKQEFPALANAHGPTEAQVAAHFGIKASQSSQEEKAHLKQSVIGFVELSNKPEAEETS